MISLVLVMIDVSDKVWTHELLRSIPVVVFVIPGVRALPDAPMRALAIHILVSFQS